MFAKHQNSLSTTSLVRRDTLLLDFLKRISKRVDFYNAVYVSMSKLKTTIQKNYNKTALNETFFDVVGAGKASVFQMSNDDAIIVYQKRCEEEIQACLIKLRFIFADDELLVDADDLVSAGFVSYYVFPTDLEKLTLLVHKIMEESTGNKNIQEDIKNNKIINYPTAEKPKKKKKKFEPYMLGKIQKALSGTDFASLIRRQSVCAMIGNSNPQVLFDEVFVSIADLREMLMPDVDFMSSPWLFYNMTQVLDKRVLANINRHDDGSLNSNFSININVSTILSDEFLTFDENIKSNMRATIVLELQMVDIFSDIKEFLLARTFAQDRGYKICIDGVTYDKLKYINRESLGADLVKIFWQPSLLEEAQDGGELQKYISSIGKNRVIFCRVDDEQAVEIGNRMGVTMYQGRYVQRMLLSNPKRTSLYRF